MSKKPKMKDVWIMAFLRNEPEGAPPVLAYRELGKDITNDYNDILELSKTLAPKFSSVLIWTGKRVGLPLDDITSKKTS